MRLPDVTPEPGASAASNPATPVGKHGGMALVAGGDDMSVEAVLQSLSPTSVKSVISQAAADAVAEVRIPQNRIRRSVTHRLPPVTHRLPLPIIHLRSSNRDSPPPNARNTPPRTARAPSNSTPSPRPRHTTPSASDGRRTSPRYNEKPRRSRRRSRRSKRSTRPTYASSSSATRTSPRWARRSNASARHARDARTGYARLKIRNAAFSKNSPRPKTHSS